MANDISLELTDEDLAAWQQFSGAWHYGYIKTLAHALQKREAAALKAEFELRHRFCVGPHYAGLESNEIIPGCQYAYHTYTNRQWLELAGARLRGEK